MSLPSLLFNIFYHFTFPGFTFISMRNWVDSAQDGDYWRALVNAVNRHISFFNQIKLTALEVLQLKSYTNSRTEFCILNSLRYATVEVCAFIEHPEKFG